ncbi:hypothetical protein [Haloplasma contractile]|uniref:Uncharacterized protein n=1 Tax=Haloplasma contractile SSD-17B TaxID=1033810 RepID=U2EB84_9MOLU|nr:hypothetical protein [Haloplasma contractile]ERJ12046.1 hypothetical protein HLPCO_001960 [Haloplasma contractile SSD-17B]
MRKYMKSEASQHEMKLVQMGGTCKQINSTMCYVQFEIEGIEIGYVYNINKYNKYFLERVKPYPLPIREFECEADVIKTIEIDIIQFKNAAKSRNINEFIEINQSLNFIIKEFEDLFLYYNVPKFETDIIHRKIDEIQAEIEKTQRESERVFFKKDPDNLRCKIKQDSKPLIDSDEDQ